MPRLRALGAASPRPLGSAGRDVMDTTSDVDVFVAFEPAVGAFEFMDVPVVLADEFGRRPRRSRDADGLEAVDAGAGRTRGRAQRQAVRDGDRRDPGVVAAGAHVPAGGAQGSRHAAEGAGSPVVEGDRVEVGLDLLQNGLAGGALDNGTALVSSKPPRTAVSSGGGGRAGGVTLRRRNGASASLPQSLPERRRRHYRLGRSVGGGEQIAIARDHAAVRWCRRSVAPQAFNRSSQERQPRTVRRSIAAAEMGGAGVLSPARAVSTSRSPPPANDGAPCRG